MGEQIFTYINIISTYSSKNDKLGISTRGGGDMHQKSTIMALMPMSGQGISGNRA